MSRTAFAQTHAAEGERAASSAPAQASVRAPEHAGAAFGRVARGSPARPDDVRALSRVAGNRAVQRLLAPPGAGAPLDAIDRTRFQLAFGMDLGAVRVHTDGAADERARAHDARAIAAGDHLIFRQGAYRPETRAGAHLLTHEIAHVAQGRGAGAGHDGGYPQTPEGAGGDAAPLERQADAAADAVMAGRPPSPLSHASPGVLLRSPASELISSHTRLLNLREEALGADLLARTLKGEQALVQQVFDELGTTDRDDVAEGFMEAATDAQLEAVAASAGGQAVLSRVYDELTRGSVSGGEQAHADRLTKLLAQRAYTAESFTKAEQGAKVFPFRLPGLTVLRDAPISAERRSGGMVHVHMPGRVFGVDEFDAETRTLPAQVFIGGIEIPDKEIVGVRLYDEGGRVEYRPALWLVALGNRTTTTVLTKMGEAAGIGLTLGSGALASGAAGTGAQVLMWADRVAFALGTLTSVIGEHRGFILSKFGERGRAFLSAVDVVNSVVAVYGITRLAVGAVQLGKALADWRAAVRAAQKELTSSQRAAVQAIDDGTQKLLDDVARAEAAPAAGADKHVFEPFTGDSLKSAEHLAAKNPGARVTAAEGKSPPTPQDIAAAKAKGVEFRHERFGESLPANSVDEAHVRYPLGHTQAQEMAVDVHRELEALRKANPGKSEAEIQALLGDMMAGKQIESMTNLGPHALKSLKPGGRMEILYTEKEVAEEVRALEKLRWKDPETGTVYKLEVVAPPEVVPRSVAPYSGRHGVPSTDARRIIVAKVPVPGGG